ncbi:peptidase M50 [Methylobacterium sp. J-059]|uniref:site-2 protease family protein n=1 Tax=Methylobacterium sp. J-059 TaxID=2836643 RepID=UPI001FBAD904|nr:site-2 protease family protein [Methylobacterium sp. J-059]MCJ2038383.1 peptidase M50 [Methylobacterium sp. J-059]
MAHSLFSSSWYRVANLRPRLRGHAQIHRQRFRGEVWYVLQDHQSGRFHRLSPAANLMICLMDGRRSLQEIWDLLGRRKSIEPPTQDETIRLLAQLHGSDLLQGSLPPDFDELAERSATADRRTILAHVRNPLALRMPLFDPDAALDRLAPLFRPLFSGVGLAAWLALVAAGVVITALNWAELTGDVSTQLLTAQNVSLVFCLYPIIKGLHELGHACAAKAWGCEVHEFGMMLIVFIPAPYVDASGAASFSSKWRRIVVSSAGIIVELALASAAAIVWVQAEPGLVRAAAFNVMVIASVSTLLFNGNPLLRFDGYYILADLLEIPNLASRANRYVFYLIQRHVFGVTAADSPVTGAGEAPWLLFYAIGSFLYRTAVSLAIAAVVATQFFVFGVLVAIWSVSSIVVVPLARGVAYLASSPQLHNHRARAVRVSAAAAAACLAVVFALPLPYATVDEGVVWVPDHAQLRAKTDGVITRFVAAPDNDASAGDLLLAMEDPTLDARVAVLEAQLTETRLRYDAVRVSDRTQAQILLEQIRSSETTLGVFRQRKADLVLRAEQAGRFIVPGAVDLPGRFLKRGEKVGYVLGADDPVIRVVVPQSEVDLVRSRTVAVAARFAEAPAIVHVAEILREVPSAQQEVPSLALTTQGGGTIAVDNGNPQKPQALQSLFVFDVRIPGGIPFNALGERVYVRFDLGSEPIAWRVLRSVRQTFLSQFRV